MRVSRAKQRILFLAFLGWAASASAAQADLIYARDASAFPSILGNNPAAISWTLADTWTDVEISLGLYSACGGFPEPCGGTGVATGRAFLTDSIGAGTTQSANEIAATDLSTSTTGFQTLSVFSGLTLGPGTYYLTHSWGGHVLFDLAWTLGDSPAKIGLGVDAGPTYLFLGDFIGGYAPASAFEPIAFSTPVFNISGTRIAEPVPEPAITVLTTGAIAALLIRRRRFKSRSRSDC